MSLEIAPYRIPTQIATAPGGGQTGDEVDDLMLRRLPLAVLFDLAPPSDAADSPDRWPLALNPGGFGRQYVDHASFDAPMRLLEAAIP
jgi:hypothetical protein